MIDKLTEATLAAVTAHKGIQGVSLRGVAKEAGCSHVNAYHYAPRGLPDLLWRAYTVALSEFSAACPRGTSERRPGESFGEALARAAVAFALSREGLWRLLWFEALDGQPAGEALEAIVGAKRAFRESALSAALAEGATLEGNVFGERLEIFFAYLQGEVALLINGRAGAGGQAAATGIAARAAAAWGLLIGTPGDGAVARSADR